MRYDVLKKYNHEESIDGLTPFEEDPIRAYFSIRNYKQLEFVADSRQLEYLFHLHKRNLSVPAPKQVLITIHEIIFELSLSKNRKKTQIKLLIVYVQTAFILFFGIIGILVI